MCYSKFSAPLSIGVGPCQITLRGMWYSLHSFLERPNPSNLPYPLFVPKSSGYWLSLAAFESLTVRIENRGIGFECLGIWIEMDVSRSGNTLTSRADNWRRIVLLLLTVEVDDELDDRALAGA